MGRNSAPKKLRKSFEVRHLAGSSRRSASGRATKIFFTVFLLFLGWGIITLFQSPASTYDFVFQAIGKPFEQMALSFKAEIKKDQLNRTNILLLGAGGQSHDGGFLTDTNLVLSFNHNDNSVAMISIPRDLYSEIPGQGSARMNMIYSMGRLVSVRKPPS